MPRPSRSWGGQSRVGQRQPVSWGGCEAAGQSWAGSEVEPGLPVLDPRRSDSVQVALAQQHVLL